MLIMRYIISAVDRCILTSVRIHVVNAAFRLHKLLNFRSKSPVLGLFWLLVSFSGSYAAAEQRVGIIGYRCEAPSSLPMRQREGVELGSIEQNRFYLPNEVKQ